MPQQFIQPAADSLGSFSGNLLADNGLASTNPPASGVQPSQSTGSRTKASRLGYLAEAHVFPEHAAHDIHQKSVLPQSLPTNDGITLHIHLLVIPEELLHYAVGGTGDYVLQGEIA